MSLKPKKKNKNLLYSIIVPVYNRPQEIDELLDSLTKQSYKNFEVIIIEDGSNNPSKAQVEKYKNKLDIFYYYKKNSGPGPSRNLGMKKAKGDFLIILDSDVILPSHYLQEVNQQLKQNEIDAYGGPDKAHDSFTPIQKAIDFAMTSFLTTGGIRGKAQKLEKFHPRSFNMGISKEVFDKTGGFSRMRYGEDIDLSIRIIKAGFNTALLPNAYVFHKRRNTLKQFYNQILHSGEARIDLYNKHPHSFKLVHSFPLLFIIGLFISILLAFFNFYYFLWAYIAYFILIFTISSLQYKSLKVGSLSVITSFIMLWAYAYGLVKAFWQSLTK